MRHWKRPDQGEYLPYQLNYIQLVPEGDLMTMMLDQVSHTAALYNSLSSDQLAYRYADGKWTVAEVLQHLIDCERILCYRALRFARKDNTPLPGFEENDYVAHCNAADRSVSDMTEEFKVVRQATVAMFRSFTDDMLSCKGTANNGVVSVNAFAFVIAGHELHHLRILHERYGI